MAKRNRKKIWWYVEFTDTFGGEANYSWVTRYKVFAATRIGALTMAGRQSGYTGSLRLKYPDDGNGMTTHSVRGACVVGWVSPWEDDSHAELSYVDELK